MRAHAASAPDRHFVAVVGRNYARVIVALVFIPFRGGVLIDAR